MRRRQAITALTVMLAGLAGGPATAQEPGWRYGPGYPPPSAAHIREALRYGEQFQRARPDRTPRFTTPPQAIPPEYLRVPPREYCQQYPYAPACVPPVVQPYPQWGGWYGY